MVILFCSQMLSIFFQNKTDIFHDFYILIENYSFITKNKSKIKLNNE